MFPTWNINLIWRTYITQESCLNSLLVQLPASVIDKYQPTSKTRGYFHFKRVLADDIAICYCVSVPQHSLSSLKNPADISVPTYKR